MKNILLFLFLIWGSTSFAAVESVTEIVCPLPAGCRIIIETGECIGCVQKTRKIVKKIEITKEINSNPVVTTISKKKITPFVSKPKKRNWVGTLWKCVVGCRTGVEYWDDAGNEFDKDRNLIPKLNL